MAALFAYRAGMAWDSPEAAQWAERADRYAKPDTVERAWADMLLANVKYSTGRRKEGIALLSQTVYLARRLGDLSTFWQAAYFWLLYTTAPQHAKERLELAEELAGCLRPTPGLSAGPAPGFQFMGDTFLALGQRRQAEEVWGELRNLAKRTGNVNAVIMSMAVDAVLATLDGHLEEVVHMGQSILTRGEEAGLSEFAGIHAVIADLRSHIYLGKADDVLRRTTPRLALGERALCLAHLDRDVEVAQILERRVLAHPDIASAADETPAWYLTILLEAAVVAGHRQAAELLLNRFAGTDVCISGMWYPTCIGRHLGGACALLNRPEEARKYYQEATKASTELRFRPEVALTRLQLAELLLEHYPKERAEALEHLDFAIKEFQDMKMQPSLERALRHKDILKA